MRPDTRLGLLLAALLVSTWSIGFYAIATFTFVLGIPPGPPLLGVSGVLFVILYHRPILSFLRSHPRWPEARWIYRWGDGHVGLRLGGEGTRDKGAASASPRLQTPRKSSS